MEEYSLSIAFSDSLKENAIGCISDLADVGLDSILEDGLFKDLPIFSTVISLYKIGNSLVDRHNMKKLVLFLNEINKGISSEEDRTKYREKFKNNESFRNLELEFLLVLIDRYVGYDKPPMLAKLYLAYLNGIIVWAEFTTYAEIIDRFLLFDYRTLISESTDFLTYRNAGAESILRLVALGLMAEVSNHSLFEEDGNGGFAVTSSSMFRTKSGERKYRRTEFGQQLADILRS